MHDLPVVDLGPDTNICAGSVTFDAGAGMAVYQWSDGSSNQDVHSDFFWNLLC